MPERSEAQSSHAPSGLHTGPRSTARSSVTCTAVRPEDASSTTTSRCAPGSHRDTAIQRPSGESCGKDQYTSRTASTIVRTSPVVRSTRAIAFVPSVSWIATAHRPSGDTDGWLRRSPAVIRRVDPCASTP